VRVPREQTEAVRKRILGYLNEVKQATREEICNALNLKWTTAYDNLNYLKMKGLVRQMKEIRDSAGRPKIYWSVVK